MQLAKNKREVVIFGAEEFNVVDLFFNHLHLEELIKSVSSLKNIMVYVEIEEHQLVTTLLRAEDVETTENHI